MINDNNKPKMLRQDTKGLQNAPCASAYYTMEAILRKDASHPTPVVKQLTSKDTFNKISDNILDNKHKLIDTLDTILKEMMIKSLTESDETNKTFFDAKSSPMTVLSSAAFQVILSFCDTNSELLNDSNSHYHQAKNTIASEISSYIPIIFSKAKNEITPFLTLASRNTGLNRDLIELIIRGANFDNKWLTILHDTLPTAKSSSSTYTLANTLDTLQDEIENNQSDIIELDNQITKISVRLGDLKTSELENRYQQVDNIIRMHNINSIDEGTPHHFRTLTHLQKVTRIHQLVTNHVSPLVGFSTKVITPNTSTRQFDPLAIITFSDPTNKYQFEKNLADYRKKNPHFKITTSRPNPQLTTSDRDMPDEDDIKVRLGMLYNQKVGEAIRQNPNIEYKPLNQQEIEAIKVKLKIKRKPFSTYWEFLCPSNNTTFMAYTPNRNPFNDYDFTNKIANPLTRQQAVTNPYYEKRFCPKIYDRRN